MSKEDGASPESKLNIANYFIMNAPVGEVAEVVNDVTKLVNDSSVLSDNSINRIMHDYNVEHMTSAVGPDGYLLLTTQYGKVDQDHFIDPTTGKVIRFDHRKQKFLEVSDKKQVHLDDKVNKYRAATQKGLDQYIESTYKQGKGCGLVFGSDNGRLTVCISAKNMNLSNYWTGGWRALYTISVSSSGQSELKGSVKLNVHYFEDGNVQLHSTFDKQANVNVQGEEATGNEIVKAIAKIESDFQSQLEEMYVNMPGSIFKSMRRFYPITRQPMTWNINAHTLANDISKS
jgi:capping protein alpha